jgi:pSer/pThr/pTyr-binding forkhead associated (FHA) protein
LWSFVGEENCWIAELGPNLLGELARIFFLFFPELTRAGKMTLDPGNGEVGKEALEESVEAGDREEVEKSGDTKVVDGVDAEKLKIVDPRNGEVSEVLEVGSQEVEENKNGDRNVVEGVSAVQVTAVATVAAETLASSSPYVKPPWSAVPGHFFFLEVLKDGSIVENLEVSSKGAYMFGRSDRCDFVLEHPTISRYHAVLQYNGKGEAFVYDLGSTHGTFINKRQVKAKKYAPLPVGGIIRFGHSTRLYVLQGPSELMPEEGVSRLERLALKEAEAAQQMAIRQASLLHAKKEAAAMEGVSWGMQEDAIVDDEEENFDELTWETYKGPLTEKQQKMIEKVHKRHEKMANLKKENDAIQAKEIGQGGLTQGQQTQMARNEQRIEQVEHTKISSSPLLFPSIFRCRAFVCFSMGRPQ